MDLDRERAITIAGTVYRTTPRAFIARLSGAQPARIQKYWVEIEGRRYPVKQAVAVGLGALRGDFQSQEALRVLRRLGFKPAGEEGA